MYKHYITLVIDVLLFVLLVYFMDQGGVFGWSIIAMTLMSVVAAIFSLYAVRGIEIEENASLIKKLRFIGTLGILWVFMQPNGIGLGIAVTAIALLFRMPIFIFRTTFYTLVFFIGRIAIENVSVWSFIELSDSFGWAVVDNAVNMWQTLAIGLAIALVIYIVFEIRVERSLYMELVGILTCMITPIYVLIFAVIDGMYNGFYGQAKKGLSNVQVRQVLREPSYEHYLANEGPRQLKHIVFTSFDEMKAGYVEYFKNIRLYFYKKSPIVFSLYKLFYIMIKMTTNYIVRSLIIIMIGSIHAIILYTAKGIYQLTLSIVRYREAYFRQKYVAKMLCSSCYEQHELPLYSCPNCDRKHDLVPNHFGVFHHRCACGAKLPNRYQHERQLLVASCPACEAPYTELEIAPIVVPIIGPQQVGKTKFALNGLLALKDMVLAQNDHEARFLQRTRLEEVEAIMQQKPIAPTPITSRAPYVLHLQTADKKPNQALYYFDLAGSVYEDYDMMKSLHFLSYADGYMFIMDIKKITSSDKVAIEDTLDRVLMYCQQEISNKVEDKVTIPIAFILNKADHKNLPIMNHEEIVQWLVEQDVGHFARKIDMSFTNYRFFLVSSNTSEGEQAPIHAHQWMMEQTGKWIVAGGAQHAEK